MKSETLGSYAWEMYNFATDWARPCSINSYLNETYYSGLNLSAQSQIVKHNFNIGKVQILNNDLGAQINDENSVKWEGNIGLASASEYIRADSNISSCGTFSLVYNNRCKSTNWMITNTYDWWTITVSKNDVNVFSILDDGGFAYAYSSGTSPHQSYIDIRPVIYLSSSVKITGGDGSQSNPYTIE